MFSVWVPYHFAPMCPAQKTIAIFGVGVTFWQPLLNFLPFCPALPALPALAQCGAVGTFCVLPYSRLYHSQNLQL